MVYDHEVKSFILSGTCKGSCKLILADSKISNPVSTAGGGYIFEHSVGSYFLSCLLGGDTPNGLQNLKLTNVKFQTKYTGNEFDDILLECQRGQDHVNVCFQIKRKMTFSEYDDDCKDVISKAWKMYIGKSSFRFNPNVDKLVIVTGIYSTRIDEDLQQVLKIASTSLNGTEFVQKISMPGYGSDEKRQLVKTIRKLLSEANGSPVSDDELLKLLRCLVVSHFDMKEGGRDKNIAISNLQKLTNDESESVKLLSSLDSLVGKYSSAGGSINRTTLIDELKTSGFNFQESMTNNKSKFSTKAVNMINEYVFKTLLNVAVIRDTHSSVNLMADNKPLESLPYFRYALELLEKHEEISSPLEESFSLITEYNNKARALDFVIQNLILTEMAFLSARLAPSNTINVVARNTYSLLLLKEQIWDFCENGNDSNIELRSRTFCAEQNDSIGNVLTIPIRGLGISVAYNVVSSDWAPDTDPITILPILKRIGSSKEIEDSFKELSLIREQLKSLIDSFRTKLKQLSESIDLEMYNPN